MKKGLCILAFLVLAAQLPLWGYDASPSNWQYVPEVIWAAATGGGTWITEIQVTNLGGELPYLNVVFGYSGGSAGPFLIDVALAENQSVRFSNILSTLDALDSSGIAYYGKVGILVIYTDLWGGGRIQVQARTVNGNYGKTFPGLNQSPAYTAAPGRPMLLQDLVQNATYRTSVGACNLTSYIWTVRFRIIDGDGVQVGSYIDKAMAPMSFVSFNPFKEAGCATGTYENCHLIVEVISGAYSAIGVLCYGSIANNYTNDTYAIIAKPCN